MTFEIATVVVVMVVVVVVVVIVVVLLVVVVEVRVRIIEILPPICFIKEPSNIGSQSLTHNTEPKIKTLRWKNRINVTLITFPQ